MMQQYIFKRYLKRVFWTVIFSLTVTQALAESALLQKAQKQIAGKDFKAASHTLTSAMNSGELSDVEMAKALFKRGVANNRVNRYAAAIADLTGALWLGKLSAADRQQAFRERAEAYSKTGLQRQARADLAKAGSGATLSRPAPKKSTSPIALPRFETVVTPSRRTQSSTEAAEPPKKTRKKPAKSNAPKAKQPIPSFRTSITAD
jgi:hypothetical protein